MPTLSEPSTIRPPQVAVRLPKEVVYRAELRPSNVFGPQIDRDEGHGSAFAVGVVPVCRTPAWMVSTYSLEGDSG
jgi:hypothetical protein